MTRPARQTRIDIEALKRDRPLADVIASYGIELRREGNATYRCLCPFHQEHTPSFWIDARDITNEHFYCFGECGAHGDVLTFVMEYEKCSFTEACERLTNRPRPATSDRTARTDRRPSGRSWEHLDPESIHAHVLDCTLHLYEQQLWSSERAMRYLRTRGIPEDLARCQRLGYAIGRTLVRHLSGLDNGTMLTIGVELGLVIEPPADNTPKNLRREFFFDRLIVRAARRVAHLDDWPRGRGPGRRTGQLRNTPCPKSRARPKYLALPGEKPVLGLEHVVGQRSAYLVEGPVDWLAGLNWGLPTFAICGTHFPAERLPSLSEAQAIYGVFDPDRAGLSAAERHAPIFGSRWRPIRLPNNLDLADLALCEGVGHQTFRRLVGRARAAAWLDGRV